MTKINRTIALVLAAIVFLTVAFSLCVIAVEAGHDCHGEDCAVCELIEACEDHIKGMSLISVLLSLMAALILLRALPRGTRAFFCRSQTPVSLKVKLTN